MKKIVIKEIDKLSSTLHKTRSVSEYLIYLKHNDANIKAYTEIGEAAKNYRVNELILDNFVSENSETNKIKKEDIIEEYNFQEYLNQNNIKKPWKKNIR